MSDFIVTVAGKEHFHLAEAICKEMEESAKVRGTGIAKRDPNYVRKKMEEGKAIIATTKEGQFAGFCYIETWSHGKYVSNSGLIVSPEFRKHGLATKIKEKAFELTRTKYPDAKLFGLTTSAAVMKINDELGYRAVTFSELTDDEDFWKGCQGCINYEILMSKQRKMCFCTGMLYDPEEKKEEARKGVTKSSVWPSWLSFKKNWLMKWFQKEAEKETVK
jgi:GNAT superfamily N-acetyltransferase